MNKIEIVKVEFKNFLSYGNTWQTLHLHHGINIVQGIDVNTGRSNGSGKTSVLEPISFALFGQTIKSIKKSDIPNRYNTTGCMVKLTLKIGEDEFVFHRGIKPNKFDVYKNGDKLAKLSTVRLFQQFIEEEILGMSFNTFKNLIHFSPNNTISILNAKKEQKRRFLESLFDLGVFSELNKKSNEKLSANKTSILMMEKDIENNNVLIQTLTDDIEGSVTPDIKSYNMDLNTKKIKREGIERPEYDESMHTKKSLALSQEKDYLKSAQDDLTEFNNQIISLTSSLPDTNFEEEREKQEEREKKIKAFNITHLFNHKVATETGILMIKEQIREARKDLDDLINQKTNISASLKQEKLEYERIDAEIKKLKNTDKMSNDVDCPLCKQKVNHDHVSKWYDDRIKELFGEADIIHHSSTNNELLSKGFDVKISEVKEKIQKFEKDLDNAQTIRTNTKDKIAEHDYLVKERDLSPDINKIEDKYNTDKAKIVRLEEDKKKEVWGIEMLETEIELLETSISVYEKQHQDVKSYEQKLTLLDNEIELLEKQIQEFEIIIKKQEDIILEKRDNITSLKKDNVLNLKKIKNLQILQDYLTYIKASLGDDNIKQYAISSMIPYLNKRANYYLSESGIPYILKIDGWLDVTIIGLGAGEIPYGSLSGGEVKSIDMSIQLACNDLAELQSKSLLNISILDEILDTSLDDQGVVLLMSVISARQKLNDSCTYIITHRRELTDIEYDNVIDIIKEDGFSTIKEI